MSEFKEWVKQHKALAIGLGVGLALLLYLLFKGSGSSSAGASDPTLANYYAAEAASSQSAAGQAIATNELAAQTNQTNSAASVASSQIAAQLQAVQDTLSAESYSHYLSDYAALSAVPQSQPSFSDNYLTSEAFANMAAAGNPLPQGWTPDPATLDRWRASDLAAVAAGTYPGAVPMTPGSNGVPSLPAPPSFGASHA